MHRSSRYYRRLIVGVNYCANNNASHQSLKDQNRSHVPLISLIEIDTLKLEHKKIKHSERKSRSERLARRLVQINLPANMLGGFSRWAPNCDGTIACLCETHGLSHCGGAIHGRLDGSACR